MKKILNEPLNISLDELSILPAAETGVKTRSEIMLPDVLPVFTAPMTGVIGEKNMEKFTKVHRILPRSNKEPLISRIARLRNKYGNRRDAEIPWLAVSLKEARDALDEYSGINLNEIKICIDIANGHMRYLYDTVTAIREKYPAIGGIMVGNIANPETYRICMHSGVDFVRVGIGGGAACTTSVLTGVHSGHVWLISKIKEIQSEEAAWNKFIGEHREKYPNFKVTRTIADGGIDSIGRAIKALALGYDCVMFGKLFAECSDSMAATDESGKKIYYGMASAAGQMDMSGTADKSPEGITVKMEQSMTIHDFISRFESSLRSAMSYTGCRTLDEFQHAVTFITQSSSEFMSYNK